MVEIIKPAVFWLIIFVIMVVLELITISLTSIWFAAGALAAMLLSFTRAGFIAQVILCIAISVVLLILVRPWARKHFNNGRVRTNAQSLIGQDGVVIEGIDNIKAQGRVSVNGQEWAARSTDESVNIPEGEQVVIEEISGVKLIVKPKQS